MLILLMVMLLNLILLFIIDSYVVSVEVFRETGSVTNLSTIPAYFDRITSYSAYTTELTLQGCCQVVLLDNLNNKTQIIDSNETFTKKIVSIGVTVYEVQHINGSFNYTYVVFKENKPLIYLSIPASIISFVGFITVILLLGYHLATSSSKTVDRFK